MKKYLIVTDNYTTKKGIKMADELSNILDRNNQNVYRICLEENENYQECLTVFYDIQPDKIITFDMAGFQLISEKDSEIIYNKLYAQNYHILTMEAEQYLDHLLRRMSYPSAVYVINAGEQEYIKEYYEQIFRVEDGSGFLGNLSTRNYERSCEIKNRIKSLPTVWNDIVEKTEKNWKKSRKQPYYQFVRNELNQRKIPYNDSEFVEVMGLLYDVVRLEETKQFEQEFGEDPVKWENDRGYYDTYKLYKIIEEDI